MCRLYDTWRKVKDTFVKPKLKVYLGLWKNNPYAFNIWPFLYICPRRLLHKYCCYVHNSVLIKTSTSIEGFGNEELPVDHYTMSKHVLPGNLRDWDCVWKRQIRKKLKKLHLSWLKPYYRLPSWLCFKIVNLDVGWKDKYNSPRFERPPRFSIVLFGLSLTFSLHCPIKDAYSCDDHYWESILNHLYYNKVGTLKETIDLTGRWTRYINSEVSCSYFATRPEYIVKDKLEEYIAALSDLEKTYLEKRDSDE